MKGGAEDGDDPDAPVKIEDEIDGTEDDYEKDRARFEEIKKAALNSDDDEDNEESEQPQMTTGGIETPLPIVDVEAENRAAAEQEVDEALAEDAKVELDERLKKAADEAKA